VDWRYCMTMDPEKDVEVPAHHIGMAFNPGGVCRRGRASGPSAIARIAQPTRLRTIPVRRRWPSPSLGPVRPGSHHRATRMQTLFATSKLPMPSVFR